MPIKRASLGEVKNQARDRIRHSKPLDTFINEGGIAELKPAVQQRMRDEKPSAGSPLHEEGGKLRVKLEEQHGPRWMQSAEWKSYLKRVRAFNKAMGKNKTDRG